MKPPTRKDVLYGMRGYRPVFAMRITDYPWYRRWWYALLDTLSLVVRH